MKPQQGKLFGADARKRIETISTRGYTLVGDVNPAEADAVAVDVHRAWGRWPADSSHVDAEYGEGCEAAERLPGRKYLAALPPSVR